MNTIVSSFLMSLCSHANRLCYGISLRQPTYCCKILLNVAQKSKHLCDLLLSIHNSFSFLEVANVLFSSPGCHVYSVFSLHWFLSDLLSNYSEVRLQAANQWRDLCRLNAQDPLMNHFPLHVNLRLLIHTDDKCGPIQMLGYRTKS